MNWKMQDENVCIKFNDAISWELWQFKLTKKKKKNQQQQQQQ